MRKPITILLGLALLAYGGVRLRNKSKPGWFQQLQGWQKVFGALAVILTLLIVLNPEFLALGLLGDTAFFDMLVLVLGLQLHHYATRAFYGFRSVLSRILRWLGMPSPGFSYSLALLWCAAASAISMLHRAWHRLVS
jgi:hypothetical protein